MGRMMALAEALGKVQGGSFLDEMEAKSFGMNVEKFTNLKQGYIDTYKIVTETFEKGYRIPKGRRSGFKACGNY
jgi:hypothetical protein